MSELIERAAKIKEQLHVERLEKAGIKAKTAYEEEKAQFKFVRFFNKPKLNAAGIFSLPYHKATKLYIHFPFCAGICNFCRFYTVGCRPAAEVDAYIAALKSELDLLLKNTRLKDAEIAVVYFGGGTPTFLSAAQLADITSHIKSKLRLSPGVSWTCEVSPNTMLNEGEAKLKALREGGVNRLSIGVQAFDDGLLKAIGAGHKAKTAVELIKKAEKAGFADIDIDILFGLPGQTPEKWERTLNAAVSLKLRSVQTYHLCLRSRYRTLRTQEMLNEDPGQFPGEETNLLMQIMAYEKLTGAGYTAIDLDQAYTLEPPANSSARAFRVNFGSMFGLGAGARTEMVTGRRKNGGLEEYISALNRNKLPAGSAVKLTKADIIQREVVLGLRDYAGLDKSGFKTRFGVSFGKKFRASLGKYKKLGFLDDNGKRVRLTRKGKLLANDLMFEHFFA